MSEVIHQRNHHGRHPQHRRLTRKSGEMLKLRRLRNTGKFQCFIVASTGGECYIVLLFTGNKTGSEAENWYRN